MPGEYEKPISIQDAIAAINNRDFLLPAIQRKFVWSSHQICVLFDSIMRDYPINTFIFWEITNPDIKKDYKFYEFLRYYCQRFNEENPHVVTTSSFKDFNAIIDGQQRLTSLYIGLCSTYAYKQPRVWWPNTPDDSLLPPRKLYIDLKQPTVTEDDEALMYYNFKFLTDEQYVSSQKNPQNPHHWYCLHHILNLPHRQNLDDILLDIVIPQLIDMKLDNNDFARETLLKLYTAIRIQKTIQFFKEKSQSIDYVLDVFIRTNSGGTKLDFANLLLSIAVAHWEGDFRNELDNLISEIHQSVNMGFYIERDWILKTCLMLINADVRFKVQNFKAEQVRKIQLHWADIKECIKASFIFVRRSGINPQSLISKNAVIPICYYLFNHKINGTPLFHLINDKNHTNHHRTDMRQWLYIVLLKGIFGGQADAILISMRDVLQNHINDTSFPLSAIIDRYKATNKDLRIDEEYIESLLNIQYGEGRCRAVLHLLFPGINPNSLYHIDHLHPKSEFSVQNLRRHTFLTDDAELLEFYKNSTHWNSIANLHLLDDYQNTAKSNKTLNEWINDKMTTINRDTLLVSENTSLHFTHFKDFYMDRRAKLKTRLQRLVFTTQSVMSKAVIEDSDEEVIDESTI